MVARRSHSTEENSNGLATWFRPLFETIRAILADLWVFPICLLLGLGVGAYHILWQGRKGFGSGILLSTFVIGILGTLLTNNPLTDLYSENGLLTQGLAASSARTMRMAATTAGSSRS